jgi:transposase InsO family protein
MESPNYIAKRTSEFLAEFESMDHQEMQHLAQVLKMYEESGVAPNKNEAFLTIPSADASSTFDDASIINASRHARAKPASLPDDDPPSSDSSSSDEESDSSDSSSDDSSKSGHRRSKNKKKKKKRGGSRRTKKERTLAKVTKLNRTLSSTAYKKKLRTLKNDTNPKTRRITFFNWISSVHDIFDMYHDTQEILENYPKLPNSIDPIANEAIAAFLRSYIDIDVRHLMSSVARTDGLGLLNRLKTIYASATLADQQRAQVNLQNLEMHPNETMTSIVSRFRKSLQALHHTTADPSLLPHEKSLVLMFIQKLKDNTNMSPDLIQQVNTFELASLDDACTLTLTHVEDRLCMIESLAVQRSHRTRGHGGSGQPAKSVTCTYCNKPGHTTDVCRSRLRKTSSNHQANHVATKLPNKYKKPLTCFCCGGSHHLRDCKKCDDSEKERLYRENLGPRKTSDTRQTANHAKASEPPVPPSSIRSAASKPPTEQANNAQILNVGRPSPRGTRWASANMTTVHEDLPDDTQMSEPVLYIGNVPFTCNSSKPATVPLSTKPKFNCTFRKKVPTATLRIKTKLCCHGLLKNEMSDDDSCGSMPGLLPRPVPTRVLNWADESSDDDSCDSVPNLLSRSLPYDDSSSDDDSSLGDSPDDDDSWSFIPNEYANAANDLAPLDGESAMNAIVPHDTDNPVSRISDWLIDSGASSHMTPHRSDLVHNVERSHAIVEVANGVLIRAELRGTVRIKLVDINDATQSCDILVHDVLYVPGLSRRLLSVDQWMAAGGDIHFNMNHTTIRVVDSDTDESRSFDVPKPFPSPKSQNACQAATPPKKAIPASLLHRRLGHRTINTMIVGSKNEVWSDTTLRLESDNFCDSCQIVTARAANRGKSPLDVGTLDMQPGESVMVDLVTNLNKHGLTTSSHFKYYVLVTDVKTRFTVPIGTNRKTPADIARCLATWATDYGPDTTFNLHHLKKLRGDADESYFSANFIAVLLEHRINGTFAAPRHQEQNGICERTWQSIRDIAFKTMVFAHVGDEFYDFAIEHAWKVFNLLPLRDLVDSNGDPCTPLGAYTGTKPKLSRLRVLFCPCVINNGQTKRHIDPAKPKKARKVNTRSNCAERGTKAIHVGLPRYQNGWLCYIPSTGGLRVSQDVSFDEQFYSTTAHFDSRSRFTGGIANMPISLPLIPQSHELERTGNAWPFTHADDDDFNAHELDTDDEAIQRFANPTVDELFDQVEEETPLSLPTIDSDDESSAASLSAMERLDHLDDWTIPVDTAPLFATPTPSFDYNESDSSNDDDDDDSPREELPLPARRARVPTNYYAPIDFNAYTASRASLERHAAHQAHAFHSGNRDLPTESYMRSAFQAEVNDVSVTGEPADPFQPEPAHWRQILTMPEHIKVHWINSFRKELRVLFKMNTFSKDVTVLDTDDIIPVTAKYRTKLQSNGTIEKLKTRICLRGDLQSASEMDTWCAIAGFRALKIFLAVAARTKCRVHQLDFIGAFLQSYAIDRTVTMLPVEWKELFPEYADWFGIPLLCVKSIYGGSYANRSFDIHLSTWLENDQRLIRCLSEGSIFTRRDGDKFLILLNAVDDQLYMSNCEDMRKKFEKDISTNFDVELMGQAHWYLQARITQHANFDITLDQSRYAALICNRFIPSLPIDTATPEDCETYKRPLPDGFIATKEDQAKDMFEVKRLADEFGFKYSSVVGMLIFSMNTFIYLHFGIRKLAKFNTRPGRKHYEAAAHFLRHLRCNTRCGGLRYYANLADSPFTKLLASFDGPVDYPVVLCTDASWQDCPDTSRSTGCYMIFVQGGIVDAASFVPNPIALSSAESEYNAGAFGVTAAQHVRQLFQELHGLDPDTSLSIPLVMDSSSAIAIASKSRDTRHTRHIQRRVHFVRFEFLRGNHFGVKILGTLNPSDIGTKHVDSATLETHRLIVQVTVPA